MARSQSARLLKWSYQWGANTALFGHFDHCWQHTLPRWLRWHLGRDSPESDSSEQHSYKRFGSENVLLFCARTPLCEGFQHHAPFQTPSPNTQVVDACCWSRVRKLLCEPRGFGFMARDSQLMAQDILRSTVGRLSQPRTRCCQLCDSHPTGRRYILMKFGCPQQHGIKPRQTFRNVKT